MKTERVRSLRRWPIVCGIALLCGSASAQPAPTARQCFDRGVELAEKGDLEAAAREFEEAYRISPNYAVLYNLGQADAALGKAVEALKAFETYLANGGPRINPVRRTEVEALIAANRKRVGYASIAVEPEGSEVSIDGRVVGKTPLRDSLTLLTGEHGVAITRAGYTPFAGRLEVTAQKTSALEAHLSPVETGAQAVGQLALTAAFPGITLLLDEQPAAETATGPILVSVGAHRVSCLRQDYISSESVVEVTPGSVATADCDLVPEPHLAAANLGILTLSISQPSAAVRVDGRSARSTLHLPRGPHSVLVRCDGFRDWTQTVAAQPGFPRTIEVQLQETPERALARSQAQQSKRTWAYVIGGAGLAFLGTSVTLYESNGPRFQRYQTASAALSRDIQNQHDRASWGQRTVDVRSAAVAVTRQDDAALATALAGGVLLTYSIASWLAAH